MRGRGRGEVREKVGGGIRRTVDGAGVSCEGAEQGGWL